MSEIRYYCEQGDPYCVSPNCICNTIRPKLTRGGIRLNAGAKPKYNEPTKTTSFRIPISKIDEIKSVVNKMLLGYAENNQ